MPVHLRFGRGKLKTPVELVTKVNGALASLREAKTERATEKAMEDVSRHLEQIKVDVSHNDALFHASMRQVTMLGLDDQPPNKEQALRLNHEAIEHDLVKHLVGQLKELEFETRKDVGLVVGAFLRMKNGVGCPMADYMAQHQNIMRQLMDRYRTPGDPHLGLICGGILRDCIRHENLARSFEWQE